MKKYFLFILVGLLNNFSAFSQISFQVSIPFDTIGVDEVFEIKYTLQNTKPLDHFIPPSFEGFVLMGGPAQMQQINYINGAMTQSSSYTYLLKATELGVYNINAVSIETENGLMQTEDIALVVIESINRPAPPQVGRNNPFDNDPFFDRKSLQGGFLGGDIELQMQEMQKKMQKRMYDIFGNAPLPPINEPPSKKKKPKGKVYKI